MADKLPPPPSLSAAEGMLARLTEHRDLIQQQIDAVSGDTTGRAMTAMSSFIRQLGAADAQVLAAEWQVQAFRARAPQDMDEDVYVAELATAAAGMAEPHLRVFADEWHRRHQLVAVVESEEARQRFPPARPPAPPKPKRSSTKRAAMIRRGGS